MALPDGLRACAAALSLLAAPMAAAARAQTQDGAVASTAEERYLAQLRSRIAAGDVDAEVALGNLYESGESVPFDLAQAASWYRRAAGKGHAGAQTNLALMYQDGHGVAKDMAQAVAWFSKAAAQGDSTALFSLGMMYERGAGGVPRNGAAAAAWYRKAADGGLAGAQHRLGLLYRDGRGVDRDRDAAIAWLRKAADQGDADAQIDLGVLLSTAPADVVEAHAWLNLAASRWKHEDKRLTAARLRDRLEADMTPEQRRDAYRRAADWQDAHAWRAIRRERPSAN